VISTASSGRVPAAPAGVRWIWVCRGAVTDARRAEAVRRGAYDVIDGGAEDAGAELAARVEELAVPEAPPPAADLLVAESGVSKHAIAQAARVAATSMPVLLTGETGTGKEIMARTIHAWSERRDKHFVPINCAAI